MMGMPERATKKGGGVLVGAALGVAVAVLLVARSARQGAPPVLSAEPFGPIRRVAEVRQGVSTLMGQVVRVRGRLTGLRDLNPGQPFPWDVVYSVEDGTGFLPVHWFVQQQSPKERKPPVLPGDQVIVTARLKRDVELDGKTYPILLHEIAELHNREQSSLAGTPTPP
jgi:hypothetical protein